MIDVLIENISGCNLFFNLLVKKPSSCEVYLFILVVYNAVKNRQVNLTGVSNKR